MPVLETGAISQVFDWGSAILIVTRFGWIELFAPGLPRCSRIGPSEIAFSVRTRVGDRLFSMQRERASGGKLVTVDVTVSPYGCGVLPALD